MLCLENKNKKIKMELENQRRSNWVQAIPGSLKLLFPFRMLLRLYAACVLVWDISWLAFYAVLSIARAGLELIRPPPLKSVAGEVVMVVGACRGVGKEIVKQMATKGANVVCIDINSDLNAHIAIEAQALVPPRTGKVLHFNCDVTRKEDVKKMAKAVKREVGDVTMLFHCCGIPSPRTLLNEPSSDIYKTMDLTLTSHFWLLDEFLPTMKRMNHGHIVALTSVAGLSGQKGQLPMSVAQIAVQGLAQSVLEELRISKNSDVHVTVVHVYPFIISADVASDIRLRIPSYFGTIGAASAAKSIIEAVRRNYVEVSIPRHLLFIGHLLRILPRQATVMMREMLDTGVDFG